jgi:Protein of unknown function (DUF1353)
MKTRLIVEDVGDGFWRLAEPLNYYGPRVSFTLPRGLLTDFASVPRFLWMLVSPTGKHSIAAVCHDWAYAVKPQVVYDGPGTRVSMPLSRAQADALFYWVMRESGVGRCRAYVMWLAVRLGGRRAWNQARLAP